MMMMFFLYSFLNRDSYPTRRVDCRNVINFCGVTNFRDVVMNAFFGLVTNFIGHLLYIFVVWFVMHFFGFFVTGFCGVAYILF